MQTFNLEIDGCTIEIERDEDGKFIIPDGWRGIGSALKPAWECIALARKPLSESTIARNIARWGTGAINVDACRVGTEGGTRGCGAGPSNGILGDGLNGSFGKPVAGLGRFPANLVTDGSDEVLAAFPQAGFSHAPCNEGSIRTNKVFGEDNTPRSFHPGFPDNSRSAARFYYSAKASKADRALSKHPTVKPIKLMQWLCRLITPPGGVTLDPFAGTGTTGEAAWHEGFSAVLIEREEEYQADIERRMLFAKARPKADKPRKRDCDPGTLELPFVEGVAYNATMAAE